MKIFIDRKDIIYSEKNRLLGNCITIINNNERYYYEFDINKNEAKIITNNLYYVEKAINNFREYNLNIDTFYNESRSFYRAFEKTPTFKLPIDCIQPSNLFIIDTKINNIEKYIPIDNICIPVCIIDEEYIALDGHARLYALKNDYKKLVNVYLLDNPNNLDDIIYLAKEANIRNVSQMNILNEEEYYNIINNLGLNEILK